MIAAADYWTDVIKDDHTVTIVFGYQNLDNATLGFSIVQAVAANGHASQGAIAFDTQTAGGDPREWFFDPTPKQDEEFAMKQVLVADLAPQAIALYYGGTPPDQLEVGYWGDFYTDSGEYDLYTTALHEIGHILGMSEGLPSYLAEIGSDDALDFEPTRVGGNFVEAHIFAPSGDNRLHLRASDAVMSPGAGNGDRNLPSATDIFAVASGGNWSDFRLKRVNFLAGNSWGFPLNWAAGQVPSKPQRVIISHGETVTPPGGDTLEAGTLRIIEDSVLEIGDKTLDIVGDIDLGVIGGTSGAITMTSGGKIEGGVFSIRNGSAFVSGNIFQTAIDADELQISPEGQLVGNGHVLVDSLEVYGSVVALASLAAPDDPLLLNSTSQWAFSVRFDPTYHAQLGNLVFATVPNFYHHGTLEIGAARKATFLENVTLGFPAGPDRGKHDVRFGGGENLLSAAVLEVPKGVTIQHGDLEVEGYAQVLGDSIFEEEAVVEIEENGVLHLEGTSLFLGGSYQGEGALLVNGDVTVEEDTTISCGEIDLDGLGGDTGVTVDDAHLTLETGRIDRIVLNHFNGTIDVDGDEARFEVSQNDDTSWTMAGSMVLNRSRPIGTMLAGDLMIMTGDLRVNGGAQSLAPINLRGDLNIPGVSSALTLSASGNIFDADATTSGNGELNLSQKGSAEFELGSDSNLRISNSGVMVLGYASDPLVGSVQISNRYTQTGTGVLQIDLSGETANDTLAVTGIATLGGSLRLRYREGFRAEVGDSFDVLSAAKSDWHLRSDRGSRWSAVGGEL